jgi:hypothetical protein
VSYISRSSTILLLTLAACQPAAPDPNAVERIDLDAQVEQAPLTGGLPSAANAGWELAPDNKSLRFANPAGEPLLSLACELPSGEAPRMRFVQFAAAPPGAKALFALVGNGMVARIDMDARRDGDRWLWRGAMPADSFRLDVLTGDREVIATMPGGGEITLPASPLPRQLVEWCRQQAKPVASPSPMASPQIPPPE